VNERVQHLHPGEQGIRSTLIGMGFNFVLAGVKITSGFIGHSYALIADGIESLSDVFSSLVVFVGLRIAMRPPDENHPYGHGKAEPIAGVLVGVALLVAAVFIVHESLHEIITPHHTPAPFTLAVLAAVVVIKETLFRYVVRVGKNIDSTAVTVDAWHHRSDAITSALAFVGISIALIGGKGFEQADDYAALLAAGIIAFNALRLIGPALYELTDVAPTREINDEVKAVARRVDGVVDLDKCLVRKMGLEYYVDLHVIVDPELTVWRGHAIAHDVKDAIREANPRIAEVLVHIEPVGWH
jgi:cation diffusion facilitator family transporter